MTAPLWICCHLGAREHYAIPRALHRAQRLRSLITDAWAAPASVPAGLGGAFARLSQRHHPDLADVPVRAFTTALLMREAGWRLRRLEGWHLAIARNQWFQTRAIDALPDDVPDGPGTMLFAHSYSAARIFAEGKRRGWTTVLGQIDPGAEHYELVQRLAASRPEFGPAPPSPPAGYLDDWRNECGLADWIVVNSEWSGESLRRAGVPAAKLKVIPLPYLAEAGAAGFVRTYPEAFTVERPLRALFVGTASVAKGVGELLDAFDTLGGLPVELRLVGDCAMQVPARFVGHPQVTWVGAVDRATVMAHYRACDLLVFPSHSDGFGMAQVEAQGWSLPILASRHCGRVVRDGDNGRLLHDVSANAISDALRWAAGAPRELERFSANSAPLRSAGLAPLTDALLALEPA